MIFYGVKYSNTTQDPTHDGGQWTKGKKMEKVKQILKEIETEERERVTYCVNMELDTISNWKKFIYGTYDYCGKNYHTTAYLTKNQSEKANAIDILQKKEQAATAKKWAKIWNELNEIEHANDVDTIDIIVEWTRGGAYGSQAYCTVKTNANYAYGKKTTGCGYDKRSTTIADAFDQLNGLKKAILQALNNMTLDEIRDTLKNRQNRDKIGYGVYFNPLPFFDGGIGIESQQNMLLKLGFSRVACNCGDWFDTYSYNKGTK